MPVLLPVVSDNSKRFIVAETRQSGGAVAVLEHIQPSHTLEAVSFLVLQDAMPLRTVDEGHTVGYLLDRSRVAQVAHHRDAAPFGAGLAGAVHLRESQDGAVQLESQPLQSLHMARHHLFGRFPFPDGSAQQMEVVDHDHGTLPFPPLHHRLRPDRIQTRSRRIVEVERQAFQQADRPFQLSHLPVGRQFHPQTIRIDARHPRQHTVQDLEARHLEAEETDRMSLAGNVQSHLQGYRRLAVARSSAQDRQLTLMEPARHIVEFLQSAGDLDHPSVARPP